MGETVLCAFCTHHFFDLSLGGGFLGIRKSARIGCMSQSAEKDTFTSTNRTSRKKTLQGRKKTKQRYSRGAPSAISIAVIPQDHRSLCEIRWHPLTKTHIDHTCSENRQSSRLRCASSIRLSSVALGAMQGSYSVVVRGVWVLVTGDDLRSHPVRGPDEGVPPPDRPIQLSANAKVN